MTDEKQMIAEILQSNAENIRNLGNIIKSQDNRIGHLEQHVVTISKALKKLKGRV